MGTTNTGTTQNYRVKPFALMTPVHENESLSSWLIRAALDCGIEP